MSNIFGDMWGEANRIADKETDDSKAAISLAAREGVEDGQDARAAKDWIEWIREWDRPDVGTCKFLDLHLFDDASVEILSTIAIHFDEDGLTDEDEAAIVRLMERIENSNHLMTRWEQMVETQLIDYLPTNYIMVDMGRLTRYIRAMGFVNPWEE